MADAGENKQTYAQKLEQAQQDRVAAREQRRTPEEAGKERIEWLAERIKKGQEVFQEGIRRAKEAAQAVGGRVAGVAEYAAGSPERIRQGVDVAADRTMERTVSLAQAMVAKDAQIADGVEKAMANMTGAVESVGLTAKAGLTEVRSKMSARRRERVQKRMENGHKVLRGKIEAQRALIAKLEQSMQADEAKLTGKLEADQSQATGLEVESINLTMAAQAERDEAQVRKNNGKGLAGVRKSMDKFIRA